MPSESVKVSVIVVNFNGMPYIESCIRSILKQDFAHFEVILADNKSSDNSLDYARQQFPGVLIVANEKNLGYSGGINSSIGYAHGEYLAPINVDTEVNQGWLAAMVNFMDANPEVGAVTPKSLLYRDRNRVGTLGLNIHLTGLGFIRGLSQTDSDLPQEPFQVAGISGCSYLIRREIVEKMGGLNESNFMYYDDVDLSWMINLMGYRIYCVPQSVVYHEYELKMTPQKIFWLEYGRENAILSYLRPFTFIVLTPALAFTEALITGYCLIRGPSYIKAKFKVWVSVMKNLRETRKRRIHVQKLRELSDFQLLRRFRLCYEWNQVLRILK
jgi:GT2 family glycosyltransferase